MSKASESEGRRKNAGAFLLSFAVTTSLVCMLAGNLLPSSDPYLRKLSWFTANKNDYDLVFIGNSQVYRDIAPEVFDRKVGSVMGPLRSFNFGLDSLSFLEELLLVEKILALQPSRLKYLVIEPSQREIPIENMFTRRIISQHSASNTLTIWSTLLQEEGRFRLDLERARQAALSARAMLYHYSGVGLLASAHENWANPIPDELILGNRKDGFQALDDQTDNPIVARQHQKFLSMLDQYRKDVAALGKLIESSKPLPDRYDSKISVFRRIISAAKSAGVEILFIRCPSIHFLPELNRILATPQLPVRRLRFDSPTVFKDLYEPDTRWDRDHMNRHGAFRLTERLAVAFLESVAASGNRPAPQVR